MSQKISVVINTLNEEANLPRALKSIQNFADEIVVVDMHSTDNTTKIAKQAGARVYTHKKTGYVEPARNFAISKATGNWILLLDADEALSHSLAQQLRHLAINNQADFIRIPRVNIIFNQWIKHSRWWPDYNIRFFKKGHVTWQNTIHSIPLTRGHGLDLPATQETALAHYHYQTISQYLNRLNRYTKHQLVTLKEKKHQFHWTDIITKPSQEFISRYLQGQGYRDGLHGLIVCLLQAFSELILYLKFWESLKFPTQNISLSDFDTTIIKSKKDFRWWFLTEKINQASFIQKLPLRLQRKLSTLK